MTLEEAIEVLQNITLVYKVKPWRERAAAVKLGIEALKRVQWHKDQHIRGYYEPLPGETEE